MRSSCAVLVCATLFVAFVAPNAARANGRFPAAQEVLVGPGHDARTLALRTTFGFAVSDDGGASFHWVCEEALLLPVMSPFDAPFAIAADGTLEVGRPDGVTALAPDRCTTINQPMLDGMYIGDFDTDATGQTVILVTSSGGIPTPACPTNQVYRSDDAGRTFVPLGSGVADVLFDTIEMARTDPMRVYLTGTTLTPMMSDAGCAGPPMTDGGSSSGAPRVLFFRSDDGGATLAPLSFPDADAIDGAYVAAIDPTDENTVYVRATALVTVEAGTTERQTLLLKTTDGGSHWTEIARTHLPMTGFALADDGRTLWIGSADPRDGLQRSDDAGGSWTRIGDQQVLGLRFHEGVLYLTANFVLDHFALGRSTDMGATFTPVLQFEHLEGPFSCPSSADASIESTTCAARWPMIQQTIGPTMDAGFDVNTDASGENETGTHPSCACRTGSTPRAPRSIAAVSITTLLALLATRSRRSRRSP